MQTISQAGAPSLNRIGLGPAGAGPGAPNAREAERWPRVGGGILHREPGYGLLFRDRIWLGMYSPKAVAGTTTRHSGFNHPFQKLLERLRTFVT
jgi:hypothetical protein